MMTDGLELAVKRLHAAYTLYYLKATPDAKMSDAIIYANECTTNYVDYAEEACKDYKWRSIALVLENQIRILGGFIECYDKLIERDKVTFKTRWSL